MRKVSVSNLIQRTYGKRYQLTPSGNLVTRQGFFVSKMQSAFAAVRQRRFLILIFTLIAVMAAGSIYCYNLLVQTEQDVLSARGKVAAMEQRRNDISINLSKAVFDYSRHERSVFTGVVALRSLLSEKGMKGPELKELAKNFKLPETSVPGMGPEKLAGALPASALGRILAIAEQYPDLKLSATFQNLMTALIEVEKDLATERIRFNDAVNIYTTNVAKFPINFHAWLFGFESRPYFEATGDAKSFKPIDY